MIMENKTEKHIFFTYQSLLEHHLMANLLKRNFAFSVIYQPSNQPLHFFMEIGLNPYLFLTLLQKFMLHPQSHINESLQFQIYSIQDTHKNSTPQ